MTTHQTSSNQYCAILINCAHLVLRLAHDKIKESYSDNPIYVAEYIEKGNTENIIYIRFDAQRGALSCNFDQNNNCNTAYIFLDNLDEIDNYIAYLHDQYDYNYIRSCWVLPDSFLSIERNEDDIYFVSFY